MDLAITGTSDSPNDITLGQGNVTYTVTTYNASGTAATNAILTLTLPASSTYVSSSSANYTCTAGTGVVTCTLATFNAFTSPSATVTVTPGAGGVNTFSATITADQPDPVTSNNSDTETTTVNATIDLAVTSLSDSPADVTLGQGNVAYTINTYNYSSSKATNAVLTINIPASSTFVSFSSTTWTCSHSAGVVTCTLPAFNAFNGPAATVTVTPGAGGTNTLTASIAADQGDPNLANNTGSESTTVNDTIDLAITGISDSPGDVTLGQGNVTYTINTYNYSTSKATNAVLTINLPASSTYVSSTSTTYACAESGGVVTCSLASFNAFNGPSATVTVTPGVAGTNTLMASIAADQGDSNTANNSQTEPTTVNGTIDLAVTGINDVPADITLGQGNVTYNIDTYNYSTSKATNLVLTINLPASSTYVSSSGSYACTESAGVVTCTLSELAAFNSRSASVTVTPGAGGTNTLTATVSADQGDPVSSNNTQSESTTVNATIDLAVTGISDAPADITLGQGNVTYSINTYNYSTSKATNAVLTINLPASSTFVSASGTFACTESAGVVTCTLATFNASNSPSATVVVTPGAGGTNTLTASIAADQGDPNMANNTQSEATTVNATIDLAVTGISDSPADVTLGQGNVTYTINTYNYSTSKATNAVLTINLPASSTYVSSSGTYACAESAGVVTCTLATFNASNAPSATIVITPGAGGTNTLTASIAADQGDPNMANNSDSELTTVNATIDLAVTGISDNPAAITLGQGNIVYTINTYNYSTSKATNAVLTINLPASSTFVSASGPYACSESGGVVTCTLATFNAFNAPAATITVTPGAGGTSTLSASISADQGDPNMANNSDSEPTTVNATIDLQLSINDTPDPRVLAAGNVTYSVTIFNLSSSKATNPVLTFGLPATVTYVSATPSVSGSCSESAGVVTCTWVDIAASTTRNVSIVVTPNVAGQLSATGTVSADQGDPNTANNSETETTNINPGSAPVITSFTPSSGPVDTVVTITGSSFFSSTSVKFNGVSSSFTVNNDGSITATVPAGATTGPIAITNSVGTTTSTGTFTVTPKPDLTISKTASAATVPTSSPLTYTITVTNAGAGGAANVIVTDTLPSGVTLVSNGTDTNWSCSGNPVITCSFNAGTLAVGTAPAITIGVTAPATGTTITNTATVSTTTPEVSTTNNSSSVSVGVVGCPGTPAITAPASVCASSTGHTASTPAVPGATYAWTIVNGSIAGSTTSNVVTFDASTTDPITLTVSVFVTSCPTATNSATVSVSTPTATITPSGPTTFCAGNSVTLTANNGASWLWSTGATTQSITVSTSQVVTVTVTDAAGCAATSAATTVTVNPPPATPTISAGGPTTFCAGGSVTLTSSSPSGNQWKSDGTIITGATGQTFVATVSGNYTVAVTDGNGCLAESAGVAVQSNFPPAAPTVTASGPTTFCAGGSVTLTSSTSSGNQWKLDGSVLPGETGQSIIATAAGSYTVAFTDGSGCSAESTPVAVQVNPAPATPTIAAGGPTTFCSGGSVTLNSSSPIGNQWKKDGAVLTGQTAQTLPATASGSYTVIYTDGSGCSAESLPVVVTVQPPPAAPVITASGPTSFCAGGSVTLTSSSTSGNQWMRDGSPISGEVADTYLATMAGTYSVVVTDGGGCSSESAPAVVQVFPAPPAPAITASGPTSFCSGGSVTLTASAGASYLWSNGATTQSIIVSAAGSYSVTVTDANGCAATSSPTTVSVSASPVATITASGPLTFCAGGSVVLTASSGASWLWSNGATTQSITVSGSGDYSVTVTGTNGCSAASSPVGVVVNDVPPMPVITASGPTSFCAGGSVTLTAPPSASYLWSNGATTQSITVSASGSYDVTVTNAGGCSASSAPVSVSANPLPPAPTITASGPTTFCQGGSVTLTASAGSSWLWSNGAATQSITVISGGSYSVTVADANGCTATSAPTTVTVTSPPSASISGPASLCGAGTATLTVVGSGISGVTWSTGATSTSITVAPTSTTTYSAVVVAGSCTTTVSHTITVSNAGPPLSINAPVSVPALSAGNVASVPGGTAESYSWSISNGTITSGQGTPVITFTAGASGAVTLNVTMESAGCPSNGTTTIAIESCATVPPSLISPAPGTAGAQSPVTFAWSAVAGAVDYEVWRVVTGSSPALIGTTAATSLTANVPSGSYGWYVTARLQQSCAPQRLTSAEVRAITVVPATNCPTLAPALVSPASGSTPFSPVLFDWTGVPDAIGYRVMVSLGGLPPIELDSTDGDTTDLIAEIPVGAVSWWVEAIYPGCPPVASAIGDFRVELEDCSKHERARLLSPANDAVADSSEVTFAWGAVDGADGYAVWAVLDEGPSKIGETLGATSLTAVVPVGRREWYVETLFEGCPSTESDHRFLVVPASANCSAAAPELLAPAAATVSSPNVTFTWSSVPGAVLYELWLSAGGGAEALIGRTTSTSLASEVPAGAITWFVRARLNGCPHVDSPRRDLRYEPPAGCSTMVPMPLLPMDDGRPITSPVAFRWTAVPGATHYKLYLGRGASGVFELKATTSVPEANGIAVSNGESRWFVEAVFNGCPSTRSSSSRFVAVPIPTSCIDLAPPVISLPGQISAGTPYTVQWTAVPGAESYLLTEFIGSTARTMTINGQSAQFHYDNPGSEGHMYVYRVRGVDADCNPAREGALSTELGISILPQRSSEASALVGSQSTVQHTIAIGADRAGQTFVATAVQPWITVTPSTGVVPAGGIDLVATADVTGLPLGTSLGTVSVTFGGGAGSRQVTTSTGPVTTPISVSLVTPVTPTPKSTPPPDALIIPAVAHADGINAQFRSDVRVSNTSPQVMKYQLTFVPSGETGITQGRQTTLDVEPGRTIALDDVLRSWFGTGDSSILGTLEIRPLTQSSSATSSAAARGVPNFVTFASSRTFNQTANGTFGTYIAAIPFANFIARSTNTSKSVLSMQQIAQSSVYRTNLGFVEGSGNPAELLVSVFASSGAKITDFPVSLTGGQHLQMNSFLAERGIQLDDGRLEVQVTSGSGRVTSYASVVNNTTGDSLVVTPTTLGQTTSTKYVLPGVAELSGGVVWQTDMRLFNAGAQPVMATLTLQSLNGSPQQQASVQLAAGEVKQLDRVLATLFGVANDGGALHITTEGESKLIATARTFRPAGDGANFGQFIQAVTPDQAIALGSRPLQLLQVEESSRFRSNVGIAEVSGRPAKVELTVVPPDARVSAKIEVDLAANQFRQLNSLLAAMGLRDTHNARVTVKVTGGQGRVTAYAATIDALTQDPTFIPAQ